MTEIYRVCNCEFEGRGGTGLVMNRNEKGMDRCVGGHVGSHGSLVNEVLPCPSNDPWLCPSEAPWLSPPVPGTWHITRPGVVHAVGSSSFCKGGIEGMRVLYDNAFHKRMYSFHVENVEDLHSALISHLN